MQSIILFSKMYSLMFFFFVVAICNFLKLRAYNNKAEPEIKNIEIRIKNPLFVSWAKEWTDAIVPERQLNLIKEFMEFGYSISQYDPSENLEIGDVAEIMEGPLKGQEAEISKLGDENYLLVTIEAMNQSFKVKLPKEILKLRRKKPKEEIKPLW